MRDAINTVTNFVVDTATGAWNFVSDNVIPAIGPTLSSVWNWVTTEAVPAVVNTAGSVFNWGKEQVGNISNSFSGNDRTQVSAQNMSYETASPSVSNAINTDSIEVPNVPNNAASRETYIS